MHFKTLFSILSNPYLVLRKLQKKWFHKFIQTSNAEYEVLGEASVRSAPAPKPPPSAVNVSNDSTTAKCAEARMMKGLALGKYELHECSRMIVQAFCVWSVSQDPEFLLRMIMQDFNKHCQSLMCVRHPSFHY